MSDLATKKQEIFDYVHTFLGGGMIDVELDPVHYETALTKALTRFRQRSDNSVEESYLFMPTVIDQNEYTLPNEVIEVRQIFRRSIGARPSTSASGGPIFSTSHIASASNNKTFEVNYNLSSIESIIVRVNGETTTDYVTDDASRTITFNTGLSIGDTVGIQLFSSGQSGGGSLFSGFAAMDAIARCAVPTVSIVEGRAASAATLMSVAADKRLMTPHSMMLIHQLSSGMWGTYENVKDHRENVEREMDLIRGVYLDRTKLSKKVLKELLKRDLYFPAADCIKMGLVDGIYGGVDA